MSLHLDLLRYGETESGSGFRGGPGSILTVRGQAQVRMVVEGGRWDLLTSSPSQRCRAFAKELARRQGIGLELENDLCELHLGAREGRSVAALIDGHSRALGRFRADPYAFTPLGGEPLPEFEARVLATQRRLRQHHTGRHVLLVAHDGVVCLLLARARDLSRERLLQVDVGHGALFGLRVGGGDGRWHECRGGE